jgi:hypothetical protein
MITVITSLRRLTPSQVDEEKKKFTLSIKPSRFTEEDARASSKEDSKREHLDPAERELLEKLLSAEEPLDVSVRRTML